MVHDMREPMVLRVWVSFAMWREGFWMIPYSLNSQGHRWDETLVVEGNEVEERQQSCPKWAWSRGEVSEAACRLV